MWGCDSSMLSLSLGNVDTGVCALCGKVEAEIGCGFTIPPRWEKLYPNRLDLIRLCRALGFREPLEVNGVTNSNLASLKHVLALYHSQFALLLNDHTIDEARRRARYYMQKFEFGGRELGAPNMKDLWLNCGLLSGEEDVPLAFKREYCGKVFHFACVGLLQKPRSETERVPCLHCLSDRRFRARPPPAALLIDRVMYNSCGLPRILGGDELSIPTLHLDCSCKGAIGSGLPCEGMLAVARHTGSVISFQLFHPHWFSHKVREYVDPEASFEGNERLVMDVDVVIGRDVVRARPATLEDGMPAPEGVRVHKSRGAVATAMVITQSVPGGRQSGEMDKGKEEEAVTLVKLGVVPPPAGSKVKKSRRYKPRNSKK